MSSTSRSSDHIGEGADGAVKLQRQPPPPSAHHHLREREEEQQGLTFMAATLPPTPLIRHAPAAQGGGGGNSQLLGAAFDVSLLAMKAKKSGGLSDEDLALLNHHADAIRRLSVTYLRPSSAPSSPSSSSSAVTEQRHYSSPSSSPPTSSPSPSSAANFESVGAPLVRLRGEQLLASAHGHSRDAFVGQCAPAIRKRRNRGQSLPRGVPRECAVCSATETVQWRSGADGRPTLCNACGLRFRHTMRKHRETQEEEELNSSNDTIASSTCGSSIGGCISEASPPQERRRSSIYSLLN